jgi:hypothetical protein
VVIRGLSERRQRRKAPPQSDVPSPAE